MKIKKIELNIILKTSLLRNFFEKLFVFEVDYN